MTEQPRSRGWFQHPDDPAGVQRWFNGSQWTTSTTGSPQRAAARTSSDPAGEPGEQQHPATAPVEVATRDHADVSPTDSASLDQAVVERVAERAEPVPDPPRTRGWHHYPGDPAPVMRWHDGTWWTAEVTGGTAQDRVNVQPLPPRPSATAQAVGALPTPPASTGGVTSGSTADDRVHAARRLFTDIASYHKVGASFGPGHGLETVSDALREQFTDISTIRSLASYLVDDIAENVSYRYREVNLFFRETGAVSFWQLMGIGRSTYVLNRVSPYYRELLTSTAVHAHATLEALAIARSSGGHTNDFHWEFMHDDEWAVSATAYICVYRLRLARRKFMAPPFA